MAENPATVLVSAIAYEAGASQPLRSLQTRGLPTVVVEKLLGNGTTGCSVLDRPPSEALRDCLNRSMALSGARRSEVDTVLLVTETFQELLPGQHGTAEDFKVLRNEFIDFLLGVGITNASVHCLTFSGCANVLLALQTARSLVLQGMSRHVLLLAVEKYPSVASRLMSKGVSIAGDGAASCVVSAEFGCNGPAYRLDWVNLSGYSNSFSKADAPGWLVETVRVARRSTADCYARCGARPEDFRWLVLGDYSPAASLTYGRMLGFTPQRTYMRNTGTRGHIPFDALINLQDMNESGSIAPGERALLILFGPTSCGAVAVTRQ